MVMLSTREGNSSFGILCGYALSCLQTVREQSKAWTEEQLETGSVLSLVYGKFIDVWRQKEAAVQNNQLQALLLSNASHEGKRLDCTTHTLSVSQPALLILARYFAILRCMLIIISENAVASDPVYIGTRIGRPA
jgi:hypothetical protein